MGLIRRGAVARRRLLGPAVNRCAPADGRRSRRQILLSAATTALVRAGEAAPLRSSDHFSVDGRCGGVGVAQELQPRTARDPVRAVGPQRSGRLPGEKAQQTRRNASSTDPEALLARKVRRHPGTALLHGAPADGARHALIVAPNSPRPTLRRAATAIELLARLPDAPDAARRADKGYDTTGFVADCRQLGVTPHVAQHTNGRPLGHRRFIPVPQIKDHGCAEVNQLSTRWRALLATAAARGRSPAGASNPSSTAAGLRGCPEFRGTSVAAMFRRRPVECRRWM